MTVSSPAHRPHIVTIGDVMLDVIVSPREELHLDDDINALIVLGPGGQAANVATWAVELGAAATVIGPRGDEPAARFVAERLHQRGVSFVGVDEGRVGTVVSIIEAGTRTMASDAGTQGWMGSVPATAAARRRNRPARVGLPAASGVGPTRHPCPLSAPLRGNAGSASRLTSRRPR